MAKKGARPPPARPSLGGNLSKNPPGSAKQEPAGAAKPGIWEKKMAHQTPPHGPEPAAVSELRGGSSGRPRGVRLALAAALAVLAIAGLPKASQGADER